MYKSLTKTKKYSELEAHETLKRVASTNAMIKHYKSSSLITVKRHAMVLSFFKSLPCGTFTLKTSFIVKFDDISPLIMHRVPNFTTCFNYARSNAML